MKKNISFLLLLILVLSAFAPAALAQDTVSTGCTATSGAVTTFPTTITDDFLLGEEITFVFTGAGSFTVNVNGNPEVTGAVDGDTVSILITVEGSNTIEIVNATSDTTSSVDTSCLGADEAAADDYPPGMICHFPPGNPENAHTINVGESAVQTHIDKHGDTLGPCPSESDTKIEAPDIGAVIFVEPLNGVVKFYSDCTDVCENEIIIVLVDLIDFSLVTDGTGFITLVDDDPEDDANPYVQFGDIAVEGPSVVIYYLHPDPDDATFGVFQVNIYFDGTLVNDSTLLFMDAEGTIVKWTDQSYWEDEAEESED